MSVALIFVAMLVALGAGFALGLLLAPDIRDDIVLVEEF